MACCSRTISEMLPEIHTVENYDFIKPLIHSQITKFSVFTDSVWVKIHHDEPVVPENLLNILQDSFTVKPEPVKSENKGTRVIDVLV